VDFKFDSKLKRRVTLDELRECLPACGLFRYARLSVVPFTEEEFLRVVELADLPSPVVTKPAKARKSRKAEDASSSSSSEKPKSKGKIGSKRGRQS